MKKFPDAELTLVLPLNVEHTIVRATIREGLSVMTEARIEIATTDDVELEGLDEQTGVLTVTSLAALVRRWTLMVDKVEYLGDFRGSHRWRITMRPPLWFLRYSSDTRKFRLMNSQQIITQIFGEHGVDHAWENNRTPEMRKYCMQYRETHLDFVKRLLEFEGIYFLFDDDGHVVLGDSSNGLPEVEEAALYNLIETSGVMTWHKFGFSRIAKGAEVASGAATVNDYNWKKPKIPLIASAADDFDAELEIYDYPVGYRRPDQGVRLAQHRLEALRVPARFVEGDGNVAKFRGGRHFTYAGPGMFAGRYLIQRVDHHYMNTKFDESLSEGSEGLAYTNAWHAIPDTVPFRPAVVTPHPVVAGSHTAMVRGPEGEEIHTDQYGRYRAQFHWDREAVGTDEDSRWLRNVQETQTGMGLARVGWEQSIAYIDGDPDRPIGFARNINGTDIPTYNQPANKTRMSVKTPTYPGKGGFNELRLEDLAGSQAFDWHAEKDLIGMVNNNRVENVGGNETKQVNLAMDKHIGTNETWSIGQNFEVEIGSNTPWEVGGNRDKTVGGDEEIDVGGVYGQNVGKNETETVKGKWKFEVGENDTGTIHRIAADKLKRTVNADHTIEAKGNIDVNVGDEFTEKITGSKTTTVKDGGIGLTINGKLTSEVTGNVTRVGKEGAGFGADESEITIKGTCAYTSNEMIEIRSKHIRLVSHNEMELKAAGMSIKLTKSSICVKGGVMKLNSKSTIDSSGGTHNTCN